MRALRKAILLSCFLVVSLYGIGFAHRLLEIDGVRQTVDDALRIEAPDVSQVAYVTLPAGTEYWVVLDVVEPTSLSISLGVPVLERLAAYRPNVAVLGPGLGTTDLALAAGVSEEGLRIEYTVAEEPDVFSEPVTGTDSWILLDTSIDLPEAQRYYIVVWSDADVGGKAWVALGDRDVFGVMDVVLLPAIIRNVREFHEASSQISHEAMGSLVFLFLCALLVNWAIARS